MDAATVEPSQPEISDKARRLIEGPILRTLLALSAPTIAVLAFQTIVHSVEGYYVGFLGAEALAGISLSFPLVMLMSSMAGGAFGGGISSAVSRAIGAGKTEDAARLAGTALFIGGSAGLLFTFVMLAAGDQVFRLLGAHDGSLAAANQFSRIYFLGAIPFWIYQTGTSCLRGAGNTKYPAIVGALGGIITLVFSPLLIFGVGPFPRLGLSGAALSVMIYNFVSAALILREMAKPGSPFQSTFRHLAAEVQLAKRILRVAIPSAVNAAQTNLTVLLLTSLVAPFGTAAIAGYGMAGRLELMMIPVVIGIGSALVPMVGANLGAGRTDRVVQATRAAVIICSISSAVVSFFALVLPHVWMNIFTTDPDVERVGSLYLMTISPVYFCFGAAIPVFFAAQGMGRVGTVLLAGFTRLLVAGIGGYVITRVFGWELQGLFVMMGCGLVAYALVMAYVGRRYLGLVPWESASPPKSSIFDTTPVQRIS